MEKKVKCLQRLFDVLKCKEQLLNFLLEQKMVNLEERDHIVLSHHSHHAPKICSILEIASNSETIQLLDYEWSILPQEKIALTIVTERDKLLLTYES